MLTPPRSLALLALLVQSNSLLANAAVLRRQTSVNVNLDLSVSANTTASDGNTTSLLAFEITQDSETPNLRSAAIDTKRVNFLYGPPLAGGPSYPIGPLALAKKTADLAAVQVDETPQLTGSTVDGVVASLDILDFDGLESLEGYEELYNSKWELSLPEGPSPGALTNYSQDLFFSMERLANSPYQVRRLDPGVDSLAFKVEDGIAQKLAKSTLQDLFQAGRLFYADYRDQNSGNLDPTGLRYAASCDAYFFIHPDSGDFLPLAIRTNVGANLIYTPADSFGDWMLAKMMLNANDFWFAQWNHLAQSHEVVQINYMAAVRTLSEEHPVLGLLNHLMFEVFAIQPLAKTILFTPGTTVDALFAFTGRAAQAYSTDRYFNKGAGAFQRNYFVPELERRGLLNAPVGPELKHFPFYEDASVIHEAISRFMTSLVSAYYASDTTVANDHELQSWATEANGPAEAIDFPSSMTTKQALVDILTHFAHLSTVSHHTVNTNALGHISAVLPFHPPALYKELPTTKSNNTNPADYLPPLTKCIRQFNTNALFARPRLADTKRSLMYMFSADKVLLHRMKDAVGEAAEVFEREMAAFSQEVGARSFDGEGLSQGMPFIWTDLDPDRAPWGITT